MGAVTENPFHHFLISHCRFLFRLLAWIWRSSILYWLIDWSFAPCLSPVSSRPPFRVPGARGEGRRLGLAGGIRASGRAGAAPPTQSLFPECRAHPGAAGERERPGEGRRQRTDSGETVSALEAHGRWSHVLSLKSKAQHIFLHLRIQNKQKG